MKPALRIAGMCLLLLGILLILPGPVYAEEAHTGTNYRIAQFLVDRNIPKEAVILAISTLPIVELRGAIPVAHVLGMHPLAAYLLAVAGNMLPVIPILLLLGPVSSFLMRFTPGRLFFTWLFARTRRKSGVMEKYGTIGLTLFVAIPLPVTGAWTGCAAAFLLGFSVIRSTLCCLGGVMISGVIVTVLSLMGRTGAIIAGTALLFLLLGSLLSKFRATKNVGV